MKYEYTGGKVSVVKLKGVLLNPDVTIASSTTYWPFGPANAWTWGNTRTYSRSFDSDGRLTGFPISGTTKILIPM